MDTEADMAATVLAGRRRLRRPLLMASNVASLTEGRKGVSDLEQGKPWVPACQRDGRAAMTVRGAADPKNDA